MGTCFTLGRGIFKSSRGASTYIAVNQLYMKILHAGPTIMFTNVSHILNFYNLVLTKIISNGKASKK